MNPLGQAEKKVTFDEAPKEEGYDEDELLGAKLQRKTVENELPSLDDEPVKKKKKRKSKKSKKSKKKKKKRKKMKTSPLSLGGPLRNPAPLGGYPQRPVPIEQLPITSTQPMVMGPQLGPQLGPQMSVQPQMLGPQMPR